MFPMAAHAAIDWGSVSGKDIVLFYPGQASWEWALTPSDMSGADDFRKGKNCDVCHIGEEKDMGPQIVTGKPRLFKTGEKPPIEPTPMPGKPGGFPATVKVANDGTNLYVHLEFNEGAQPDAKQDPAFATKVTVMFDNGKVPEANRGGCFAACHDDSAGMASGAGANRTMYLPRTHAKMTRQGGGDALKGADDLAKLKADGYQLEFWQASLNPGQPAKATAEIVFDKREVVSPNLVTAEAKQTGGVWSVTLSRPLQAAAPYSSIVAGGTYYIGFAIHSGHTARRFHYVSYERTLAIDSGTADLVAMKK
ncbi:MAG TPA: cytochrome c-552 precursor [Acetobacteraceae bacterium]|nr:cytochrome c-552 precursor [Acetobacteraceae bacterium]